MLDKKYNKVLTIILVIVVIAIFVILGFWGYDLFQKYSINSDENDVGEFKTGVENVVTNQGGGTVAKYTYKGFTVLGQIEIPATKISYPILNKTTVDSMKVSVGVLYGVGLNKVGNTVIAGHNYRNSTFFSNNKNLKIGDVIYITDMEGLRVKYTIYNIYTTSSSDFDYANRDTGGKREISLTTCTNDVNARLVIWAKED